MFQVLCDKLRSYVQQIDKELALEFATEQGKNLKNLDELPSLAEIRDLDAINAELELVQQGLDPNGQLDVDDGPEDGVDDATTPSQALDSMEEAEVEPAVASADEMIQEAPTDAEESVIVKPDENT